MKGLTVGHFPIEDSPGDSARIAHKCVVIGRA